MAVVILEHASVSMPTISDAPFIAAKLAQEWRSALLLHADGGAAGRRLHLGATLASACSKLQPIAGRGTGQKQDSGSISKFLGS